MFLWHIWTRVSAISLTWDIALINKPRVVIFFFHFESSWTLLRWICTLISKTNQTIEIKPVKIQCQWKSDLYRNMTFGVLKVFKGQENLLLKNLQVKTRVENVRFLSWRIFFVGKYGIQSNNEMAFKRTVTLHASFRFPAITFDAHTLLSFSGSTHAHAKCPPVMCISFPVLRSQTS